MTTLSVLKAESDVLAKTRALMYPCPVVDAEMDDLGFVVDAEYTYVWNPDGTSSEIDTLGNVTRMNRANDPQFAHQDRWAFTPGNITWQGDGLFTVGVGNTTQAVYNILGGPTTSGKAVRGRVKYRVVGALPPAPITVAVQIRGIPIDEHGAQMGAVLTGTPINLRTTPEGEATISGTIVGSPDVTALRLEVRLPLTQGTDTFQIELYDVQLEETTQPLGEFFDGDTELPDRLIGAVGETGYFEPFVVTMFGTPTVATGAGNRGLCGIRQDIMNGHVFMRVVAPTPAVRNYLFNKLFNGLVGYEPVASGEMAPRAGMAYDSSNSNVKPTRYYRTVSFTFPSNTRGDEN